MVELPLLVSLVYLINRCVNHIFGGLAQLARAPALQAGGQRFESVILHQKHIDMLEAENRTERPPWTPARESPAGQEDKLM